MKIRTKAPHHLVALGSAAVIGIYSAGFMRTRAAAARFVDEPAIRRHIDPDSLAGHPGAEPPAATLRSGTDAEGAPGQPLESRVTTPTRADAAGQPGAQAAATAPADAPASPRHGQSERPRSGHGVAAGAQMRATSIPPSAAEASTSPTSMAASTLPVGSAASPLPASMAAGTLPTVPAASTSAAAGSRASTPAVNVPSSPAVAGAAAASAPGSAEPARPSKYVDGTYLGWGTSRHGDIQAKVVIEHDRITSATIAQCLTRWDCSWISPLPPQVVARQSADVDFVSGATQSTNAFYYAVLDALALAARP